MNDLKNIILFPFNQIYRLFLWSSGADLEILDQAPTDKNKYYGIGGTIVFTALMASFAGGYAFHTAFKSTPSSIFFGLFWGALIFNLDRYIVSTFGVGDGKKTISKQELIEAAPRLVMAIILGFVIATPLELRLFQPEIRTEIGVIIQEKRNQLMAQDSLLFIEKLDIENKLDSLKQQQRNIALGDNPSVERRELKVKAAEINKIDSLLDLAESNANSAKSRYLTDYAACKVNYQSANQKEVSTSQKDYNAQMFQECDRNTSKSKRLWDNSVRALDDLKQQKNQLLESQKEIAEVELENAKGARNMNSQEISYYTKRLHDLEKQIDAKQIIHQQVADQYRGFMADLEGFSRLKDRHMSLRFVSFLITILFIFIEIAPILFKMMTERGPYDDILDRIRHEQRVKQLLLQSNLNEEVNSLVKAHSEKNAQKIEAELAANKELLESISKAQSEIAQAAINEWKKQQIAEAKNNPGSVVKGGMRQ